MKATVHTLRSYEYAFRQLEFVRPSVKYDNRVLAARGIRFWTTAQNSLAKIPPAEEVEVPSNRAPELLMEGYAEAFER